MLEAPPIIHAFYRSRTPDAVIAANRETYHRLANEEQGMSEDARWQSMQQRKRLSWWFHARGLDIDEDDEEQSIWEPWRELMEYWKGEARNAEPGSQL